MPIFEIQTPDGRAFEVDAPDQAAAIGAMSSFGSRPAQTPSPDEDPYDRSTILPLSRNKQTGEIDFTVPGILKGIYESGKSAVTAPGRAMSGELQVMGPDGHATPEAIKEGLNMSVWATPAPAMRYKFAPRPKAPLTKPEGLGVAEAAARQGIEIPRAAISDKTAVQQAGKTVANIPIAGTPLRQASSKAIGQLDDAARAVEQGYGTGSAATAGSMVRSDVAGYAKSILPEKVSSKYKAVDKLVQPNVVTPLTKTRRVAAEILVKRQNAKIPGESKAVKMIEEAANSPQGLNYDGLKDLRTAVGELMDNPQALAQANMSGAEVKRIYSALTDDLRNAVLRGGGDKALKAWESANAFAAKTSSERKALQKVIGRDRSDEAIFESLQKMAGSSSRADIAKLAQARAAVSKESWDELSSAVIARMGRDVDGNFTPDRFLTAYGKLSENGKAVLFKTTGKKNLAKSLDDIAEVSRRFKQLNQFANPSGTAQSAIQYAMGAGAVVDPVSTLTTMAGGRVAAKLLSKPMTAEKVAAWAKAYEQAALKPTPASRALLEDRTKTLTALITAERGVAAPLLHSPNKAIADPEYADPRGGEEIEGSGPSQYDPFTI